MTYAKRRKAYVSVNVNIDEQGNIMPCFVIWKNGLVFHIEKVLYKCRAASMAVSGGGIRYTVVIKGQEVYLFQEGNRWFVEAKEGLQCYCIAEKADGEMPILPSQFNRSI